MIVGVIVIAVVVAVSLLALLLVRRFVPATRLAQHTEVAGYIYAVIGVLYAVILAQVVVAAWEEYRDARGAAAAEASSVLNLARLAQLWPGENRVAVEAALAAYAQHVIGVEWPDMGGNDYDSATHTPLMHQLWQVVNAAGLASIPGNPTYPAALEQLDQLDDARRTRVLLAEDGLPTTMAITLLLGAVVTFGFSFLFAVDNGWVHGLMTASLGTLIALLLLLVFELETPFTGVSAVGPTAMEFTLNEIRFGVGKIER
jgi:hypothetical protein